MDFSREKDFPLNQKSSERTRQRAHNNSVGDGIINDGSSIGSGRRTKGRTATNVFSSVRQSHNSSNGTDRDKSLVTPLMNQAQQVQQLNQAVTAVHAYLLQLNLSLKLKCSDISIDQLPPLKDQEKISARLVEDLNQIDSI